MNSGDANTARSKAATNHVRMTTGIQCL
jgi:hypothetical protein